MLRLTILILLFTSQPVLAADMWDKACERDLAWALNISVDGLDEVYDRSGEFDNRFPRKLGAEYAPCIDELIAITEQNDWGRKEKYRQRFMDELKWVRDLLKGDMGEVYRQAESYRERNNGNLNKILAILLHQWAVEKKYPQAEFDEIQAMFAKNPSQAAIGWLKIVAGKGYVPAMLDAARRFLKGDGVKKNMGAAYYWIKRAEAAHGDLSGIIEKPYERLLDQMNDDEIESLTRSSRFFGELEQNDPLISLQMLVRKKYTKKACEESLAKAIKRFVRLIENSYEIHGKLDVRLPKNLGSQHVLCIDELIALSEQMDWGRNKIHRQKLLVELKWVRDLLKGNVVEVYRKAIFYQDRNNGDLDKLLAYQLLQWAVENNYPPAEFDEVQINFARSVTPRTGARLKRLADREYLPAMLDAARRLYNGEGVEKNLGEAYYWIKRAEAAHGDISGILNKPYERLLNQLTDHEKDRLSWSIRQFGDLE